MGRGMASRLRPPSHRCVVKQPSFPPPTSSDSYCKNCLYCRYSVLAFAWNPQAYSGSPIMRWHSVEEVVRERGSEGIARYAPRPGISGALPLNKSKAKYARGYCMSSLPRWRLPVLHVETW